MLNKIMMTGRMTTDLNVVTEEDYSYCKDTSQGGVRTAAGTFL